MIILLTDGSFNAGEVEPLVAAQIAAGYGIKIRTIGAGSRGTALGPVAAAGGKVDVSSPVTIDEQTLQQIAQLTGGKYFRATDGDPALDLRRDRPLGEGAERRPALLSSCFQFSWGWASRCFCSR